MRRHDVLLALCVNLGLCYTIFIEILKFNVTIHVIGDLS